MKLSEAQLKRLYRLELSSSHFDTLQALSKQIYPLVVEECTYIYGGKRLFCAGGTPALKTAMDSFITFVLTWERGYMDMPTFDAVLWACHNNGVFADKFIQANSEWEAIDILGRVSGIQR